MKQRWPYLISLIVVTVGISAWLIRDRWLPSYERLTGSPPTPSLTFAVIGDTEGHADVYSSALRIAKEQGAEFLLHVGDITDDGLEHQFKEIDEAGENAGLEIIAAIGSHDIREPNGAGYFQTAFNSPNLAFDRSGYRFVILDNADRRVGFSDQTLQFLSDDIAAHPKAKYILAFHRPFGLPLAAILGDDETPASRLTNQRFLELLKNVTVTAIFTGHLHIYLPYSLSGHRAFVTGGGGGEPQAALGPLGDQARHFLLVKEINRQLEVELIRLP